jgi:hypothetical protein
MFLLFLCGIDFPHNTPNLTQVTHLCDVKNQSLSEAVQIGNLVTLFILIYLMPKFLDMCSYYHAALPLESNVILNLLTIGNEIYLHICRSKAIISLITKLR